MTIPQVNTTSGATNTVSFWMNWGGTNVQIPVGFNNYDLFFSSTNNTTSFGFNTANSDIFGLSTSGPIIGATMAGLW